MRKLRSNLATKPTAKQMKTEKNHTTTTPSASADKISPGRPVAATASPAHSLSVVLSLPKNEYQFMLQVVKYYTNDLVSLSNSVVIAV